jgi:hypothetical protein
MADSAKRSSNGGSRTGLDSGSNANPPGKGRARSLTLEALLVVFILAVVAALAGRFLPRPISTRIRRAMDRRAGNR